MHLKKKKEWNDESIDEQVGTELLPDVTFDGDAHASESKDDNVVNDMEKNEWDRLLRSRLGCDSSLILKFFFWVDFFF